MQHHSEVQCRAWGGECTHLSSFGRTGRQGGGWGIYLGGVGGAGPPVKWPRGDLKCFRGSSPKAWESEEQPGSEVRTNETDSAEDVFDSQRSMCCTAGGGGGERRHPHFSVASAPSCLVSMDMYVHMTYKKEGGVGVGGGGGGEAAWFSLEVFTGAEALLVETLLRRRT